MFPEIIQIAAGFLVKEKKLFVAQRKENKQDSLKWELPGGKLEENELYDEALIREFKEEFEIDIKILQEVASTEVDYETKIIAVIFILIEADITNLKLKEHAQYKLVNFNELKSLDLCDADKLLIDLYESEIKQYID